MKKTVILVGSLLVLTGAAWYVITQTALLTDIKTDFAGYKVTGLSTKKISIELNLKVSNKSSIGIVLTGYDLQVSANNKPFARVVSDKPVSIAPKSDSIVTINVSAAYADIIGTLTSEDVLKPLISDKTKVNIRVYGTISGKVGNAISIKKYPVDLTAPLSDFI